MATFIGRQESAATREGPRGERSGVQLGRIRMDPDKFARGLGWFSIGLGGSRAAGYSRGFRHTESYSLLQRIKNGEIDPGFVVTHRMALNDAPQNYDIFLKKEDERVTTVLKP